MAKTAIESAHAHRPIGPYSRGVIARGFFYSVGLSPHDPQSGLVPVNVGDLTRQVLRSISAVLAEHGLWLAFARLAGFHNSAMQREARLHR